MSKLSRLAAGSAVLAAVAIGGAGVALADGYKAKKVVYERPADWSGVYFGLSSGYQWSGIDSAIPGVAGSASDVSHDGGVVGAHLGLQHQFGVIVLGIEGGWTSAFRDDFGSTECPPVGSGLRCEARLNDILTIGGRVGYAAGHWMPYFTGGYASARFEHEVRAAATGTLQNTAGTRNTGWYAGFGFDYVISPGWTTGLEYRHYDFDDEVGPDYTPAGLLVNDRRLGGDTDTITARVSWRWGRPDGGIAPLK